MSAYDEVGWCDQWRAAGPGRYEAAGPGWRAVAQRAPGRVRGDYWVIWYGGGGVSEWRAGSLACAWDSCQAEARRWRARRAR